RAGGFDAVGVALGVAELERILAHFRTGQDLIFLPVEQRIEADFRPDPVMMIAARADVQIVFPLLGEDHGPALLALVPQIVGGLPLGQRLDALADAAQPAHRNLLDMSAARYAGLAAQATTRLPQSPLAPRRDARLRSPVDR